MEQLMQGVTILSETQLVKLGTGFNKAFFILFVCTVFFLVLALVAANKKWEAIFEGLFWSLVMIGGLLTFLAFCICCPKYYYKQYKVLIDDNVSFTEIHEKYEVVDQEGLIYTLNSKEQIPLDKKE